MTRKTFEAHMKKAKAYHREASRRKFPPYFVWDYYLSQQLAASNLPHCSTIYGTIDYYTQDSALWADDVPLIQQLRSAGLAVTLSSVQSEEDTGLTHFEWKFEVTDNG